jgi:hypothetical protein
MGGPPDMAERPERVYSRSFPKYSDIVALFVWCEDCGVSDTSIRLLKEKACQTPEFRLAVNLKTISGLMAYHEVTNILAGGLTSDERRALVELDRSGMPLQPREIAHGLLNVHERWSFLKRFSDAYLAARRDQEEHLKRGDNTLDQVLGPAT